MYEVMYLFNNLFIHCVYIHYMVDHRDASWHIYIYVCIHKASNMMIIILVGAVGGDIYGNVMGRNVDVTYHFN